MFLCKAQRDHASGIEMILVGIDAPIVLIDKAFYVTPKIVFFEKVLSVVKYDFA